MRKTVSAPTRAVATSDVVRSCARHRQLLKPTLHAHAKRLLLMVGSVDNA
jgi:hypothetical protein